MSWTLVDEIVTSAPTPNFQHYTEVQGGTTIHAVIGFDTAKGAPTAIGMTAVSNGGGATQSQGALTTVGAGTLTAALLFDGDILRSGPTGAFTDTTDTAALIQAAWAGGSTGISYQFTYQNNTAFPATIAGGTGVTISGNTIIGPNQWARFLMVWASNGAVTLYNISQADYVPLPNAQFVTSSVTAGAIAAGVLTGAKMNAWLQTGATPGAQTVRTAAQMLADTPNGKVGMTQVIRIINTGAGTLTLTADGGATVTLTGTMTVLTNTFRDFILTFNTATTATIQTIGTGVAP